MKEHGDTVANVYATCNIICEKEQAQVADTIFGVLWGKGCENRSH